MDWISIYLWSGDSAIPIMLPWRSMMWSILSKFSATSINSGISASSFAFCCSCSICRSLTLSISVVPRSDSEGKLRSETNLNPISCGVYDFDAVVKINNFPVLLISSLLLVAVTLIFELKIHLLNYIYFNMYLLIFGGFINQSV